MTQTPHLKHRGFCLFFVLLTLPCHAEITLDGSLGGPAGELPGPDYAIQADMGAQRGGNLFHSFGDFNLNTGESATFNDVGVIAPVENILSRVTGGRPSNINGLIRTDFVDSQPNLFFMNPAGVVFGPTASLDVQGSFHVTTANYLGLGNGEMFYAELNEKTTLSVAAVEGFGFLDQSPASISVLGPHSSGFESLLFVPFRQSLSLIGGDISISDGALYAPEGLINIMSVGSAGEIDLFVQEFNLGSFSTLGDIQINHDPSIFRNPIDTIQAVAEIDVSGSTSLSIPGAGSIIIRGRELEMTNSVIAAETADIDGGFIDIQLTDRLSIDGNLFFTLSGVPSLESGVIRTGTIGNGNAGTINLSAREISMVGGALISSDSAPHTQGNAGNIIVNADRDIQIADGSQIASITGGYGSGGNLFVIADNITISGGGEALAILPNGEITNGFFSGLLTNAQGLDDPAQLQQGRLPGAGGSLSVTARDTLSIIDGGIISDITLGSGGSGNIVVQANQIELESGGLISNNTSGIGSAGFVSVSADESITINGTLDNTRFVGFSPRVSNRSGISSSSKDIFNTENTQLGNAGFVSLLTPNLTMSNGAEIRTDSEGMGNTGGIFIGTEFDENRGFIGNDSVKMVSLDNSVITAEASGTGLGGLVFVNAEQISLLNESEISTKTIESEGVSNQANAISGVFIGTSFSPEQGFFGNGIVQNLALDSARISAETSRSTGGGFVSINATEIDLKNEASIRTSTRGQATGGIILIGTDASPSGEFVSNHFVENLKIVDSQISAATFASGPGGNVFLEAKKITIMGGFENFRSGIVATTEGGTGRGGSLTVNTTGSLVLHDGGQINASTFGPGKGGDVLVKATDIILTGGFKNFRSGILATTKIGKGQGGDVTVNTTNLLLQEGGQINASTFGQGNGGNLSIESKKIRIEGSRDDFASGLFANAQGKMTNKGGDMLVKAAELTLADRATISAKTTGEGHGGSIEIRSENVVINNANISASSESESFDAGSSGNIDITATDSLKLTNNGQITVETTQADAGNINLNLGNRLQLNDNSAITTSAAVTNNQGTGNGGNINIKSIATKPSFAILDDTSQIIAQAKEGNGGFINFDANTILFRAPSSVIDASSKSGESGRVTIDSPDTNLIESALILPGSFLDVSALLSQRCADRSGKRTGSFIIKPLDGFQPAPEDYLSGFYTGTPVTAEDTIGAIPSNNTVLLAVGNTPDAASFGCQWY